MHISTRDPLAGFKGAYFKGRGGKGRVGKGRAGEGKGGGARSVCLFVLTILATGPGMGGGKEGMVGWRPPL